MKYVTKKKKETNKQKKRLPGLLFQYTFSDAGTDLILKTADAVLSVTQNISLKRTGTACLLCKDSFLSKQD